MSAEDCGLVPANSVLSPQFSLLVFLVGDDGLEPPTTSV